MYTLAISLALSFSVVFIIYLVGGLFSAKGKETDDKLIAYASGEKFPSEKIGINVENFFIYIVGFMIFDILAFVFASFMATSSMLQVIYICIVFVTSLTFFWMVKTQIREAS